MKRLMARIRMDWKKLNGKMICLILSLCIFILLTMISVGGINSNSFSEWWDPLTFVYMSGITVLVLWFTGMGKAFCNGFRLTFSKQKDTSRIELQKTVTAIRFCKKVVFLEAAVTALISMVDMLYHMSDLSCTGPALAITLLSFLYAAIFALILTFLTGRLDNMVMTYMEENEGETTVEETQTIYFRLRAMGLTDREAEVARLVSCDMSNREIGEMLYISDNTVKKHITHILEKTAQENREKLTEMIRGLV